MYCGVGGTDETWLNLSVDHVIPRGDGTKLGYPDEWIEDITNLVTCCRACNEFLNSHRVNEPPPLTLDEFYDLRDRHFTAKREQALARHEQERGWYEQAFPLQP